MASSNDTRLLPSSRDFITIRTKHNVQLLAGTCISGLKSLSCSFRHLCMTGTVLVIVMGLLTRSYFESPFHLLVDQSFDSAQSKYHGPMDTTFDQSLKVFEEDSVKASSTPNGRESRESAQKGESSVERQGRDPEIAVKEDKEIVSHSPAENSIGSERHVKDGLLVSSAEQGHIYKEEGTSTGDSDEKNSEERLSETLVEQVQTQERVEETKPADQSTTNSAEIEISPEEQEDRVELLREDLQQDGNRRTSGEDKDSKEDSKEARNRSPLDTILQPTESSARKPNSTSSTGRCDLTLGKWVHNPAGPLYRSDQCSIISAPQNCQHNGRPDGGYEFYKWEPEQCSLPRFDPNAFLELMRSKTLAFVGDSLARNQMESLMCILLQVAKARSKGSKSIHRWYFPSHNFTVIRMWSSWLVQTKGDFPPSEAPTDVSKLNLTELDDYAERLPSFDVTILSSGHWWLRKTAYFMDGEMLGGSGWRWPPSSGKMKINHSMAYEIALNTALQKMGSYPGYKGLTILRTYSPDHYSRGSWNTGGSCTGERKPYDKGPKNIFSEMMRDKQLKAFNQTRQKSRGGIMANGSKLKLLDIYPILNYRGDGHPGPYRSTDPLKKTTRDSKGRPPPQDCLHWCMPGPVDTMNELLFHILTKEMR